MEKFYESTIKNKDKKMLLAMKSLVNDPEYLTKLAYFVSRTVGTTSMLNFFNDHFVFDLLVITSFLASGIKISNDLYKSSKNYTDEYFELLTLYKDYVCSISNKFKEFNIKDPLEASIIFSDLLKSGCFSCELKFDFKNYYFDKIESDYPELLGARVLCGYGVCRHIASLHADILNEMGYTAATVSLSDNKFGIKHLATEIEDNGEKFCFCPTAGAPLLYSNENSLLKTFDDLEDDGFEVNSYFSRFFNRTHLEQYKRLRELPTKNYSMNEYLSREIEALEKLDIVTRYDVIKTLYGDKHNEIQKIKTLTESLIPRKE